MVPYNFMILLFVCYLYSKSQLCARQFMNWVKLGTSWFASMVSFIRFFLPWQGGIAFVRSFGIKFLWFPQPYPPPILLLCNLWDRVVAQLKEKFFPKFPFNKHTYPVSHQIPAQPSPFGTEDEGIRSWWNAFGSASNSKRSIMLGFLPRGLLAARGLPR